MSDSWYDMSAAEAANAAAAYPVHGTTSMTVVQQVNTKIAPMFMELHRGSTMKKPLMNGSILQNKKFKNKDQHSEIDSMELRPHTNHYLTEQSSKKQTVWTTSRSSYVPISSKEHTMSSYGDYFNYSRLPEAVKTSCNG